MERQLHGDIELIQQQISNIKTIEKVLKVTVLKYETTDGKKFNKHEDAIRHQKMLDTIDISEYFAGDLVVDLIASLQKAIKDHGTELKWEADSGPNNICWIGYKPRLKKEKK